MHPVVWLHIPVLMFRIQKELVEISLDPPSNCWAGPKDDGKYYYSGNKAGTAKLTFKI